MRARDYSVIQVLVGTHRVGLVGLRNCLRAVDESGLEDREAIVDLMMEELGASNFIPDNRLGAYRTAAWREHLRHRGEDFSEFYSEIPATLRGGCGETLTPRRGDCCVFCSYGSVPCPPIQEGTTDCCGGGRPTG